MADATGIGGARLSSGFDIDPGQADTQVTSTFDDSAGENGTTYVSLSTDSVTMQNFIEIAGEYLVVHDHDRNFLLIDGSDPAAMFENAIEVNGVDLRFNYHTIPMALFDDDAVSNTPSHPNRVYYLLNLQ